MAQECTYRRPTCNGLDMGDISGELTEYANSKAKEICDFIHDQTERIYTGVYFLGEGGRMHAKQPFLNLHRSDTTAWSDGALFTLFVVDDGDLAYEPRLQVVEKCLRSLPEVKKLERQTAPDSMVKDMLVADIFLPNRRKGLRSPRVNSRNA